MSVSTPNYVLAENVTVSKYSKVIVLEAGTFVRPIEAKYLPAHIEIKFFNPDTETFAFTSHGIVKLPWSAIRKV